MLKGDNYFFFPNAAVGDYVPFVYWNGASFSWIWFHRAHGWFDHERVVQLG